MKKTTQETTKQTTQESAAINPKYAAGNLFNVRLNDHRAIVEVVRQHSAGSANVRESYVVRNVSDAGGVEFIMEEFDLHNAERFVKPVVGMGATVCLWSDSHAYTIIAVSKSGEQITLQRDHAKFISTDAVVSVGGFAAHFENDRSQKYEYTPNPDGSMVVARLCKDQRFHIGGVRGERVSVGVRCEFYDHNF